MDSLLCDELLQEIIQLLPLSSFPAVALVSRRWLSLLRSSTTSLSLRIPNSAAAAVVLSHYPHLSSLSLLSTDAALFVAAAPFSLTLTHLRIPSPLPLPFRRWLPFLPSLQSLTLLPSSSPTDDLIDEDDDDDDHQFSPLPIESLSISGIRSSHSPGFAWLYRRLPNLRRLTLRDCEATGDGGDSFPLCLRSLVALELRKCRPIAGRVLDLCPALRSLLLHDGCSRHALRRLLLRLPLLSLDLRLPLDIHDSHLAASAAASPALSSLRLQSCCLVTGPGLRSLAAHKSSIQELGLINCDVVEREPGVLTFLAQNLPRLRRLDLSHNESLPDRELVAMLESCESLVDVRLRGCGGLTDAAPRSLLKCCGNRIEILDISWCRGIGAHGVEILILNSPRLNLVVVEQEKISEAAASWVSRRRIKIG